MSASCVITYKQQYNNLTAYWLRSPQPSFQRHRVICFIWLYGWTERLFPWQKALLNLLNVIAYIIPSNLQKVSFQPPRKICPLAQYRQWPKVQRPVHFLGKLERSRDYFRLSSCPASDVNTVQLIQYGGLTVQYGLHGLIRQVSVWRQRKVQPL